eukprot:279325-Chlamydomonas_euryale.AAC.1
MSLSLTASHTPSGPAAAAVAATVAHAPAANNASNTAAATLQNFKDTGTNGLLLQALLRLGTPENIRTGEAYFLRITGR